MKILLQHRWLHLQASVLPVPMRSDSKYQRELETAERPQTSEEQQHVQQQAAGFSYRMATGELIYALIVARLEISYAIIKLSQFNANPATIHYKTLRQVLAYLNNTRDDGLIYWRPHPRDDLPFAEVPTQRSRSQNRLPLYQQPPLSLLAYSDSDWGSDISHRHSVSGTIILLSGAAVLYSTKFQKAIALSSTEAEFVSASDTGKYVLYLRSILTDLSFEQSDPTTLLIDNTRAVFMVDAQAPTRRTRHVDIRYFALLQWNDTGGTSQSKIHPYCKQHYRLHDQTHGSLQIPSTCRSFYGPHATSLCAIHNPCPCSYCMPSLADTSSYSITHYFCSVQSDP